MGVLNHIDILTLLKEKEEYKLLDSLSEINDTWCIPGEPIETLIDRVNLDQKYIKNKKIITCNSEEVKDYNVERHPFIWPKKVNSYTIDLQKEHKEKKFVSMMILRTKTREALANNLLKYKEFGYYNFSGNSNIETTTWSQSHLPSEYHSAIWEFGIETGGYRDESYMYTVISEKTWRPIKFGKPFLVFGYPGMYKRLKSYGFILSKDVNYEFDDDLPNRFKLFCNEVERIINIENYDSMVQDALYNKEIFDKLCIESTVNIEHTILQLAPEHLKFFLKHKGHHLLKSFWGQV